MTKGIEGEEMIKRDSDNISDNQFNSVGQI